MRRAAVVTVPAHRSRWIAIGLSAFIAFALALPPPASARAPVNAARSATSAKARNFTAPRTPSGDPDLQQGSWAASEKQGSVYP